jgi:hypothetical protein
VSKFSFCGGRGGGQQPGEGETHVFELTLVSEIIVRYLITAQDLLADTVACLKQTICRQFAVTPSTHDVAKHGRLELYIKPLKHEIYVKSK